MSKHVAKSMEKVRHFDHEGVCQLQNEKVCVADPSLTI